MTTKLTLITSFPGRSPLVLVAVVLLLAPGFGPVLGQSEPAKTEPLAKGQAKLLGQIRDQDGKSPLAGVTVVAYHLSKGEYFRSEPTSKKGKFSIEDLPLGYYDVAIELADGSLYVGSAVVNLPPSGKAILTVTVAPYGPTDDPSRAYGNPATASSGAGVARVGERLTQKEFWKSPKGIAIIAGIGGTALLVWAAGSGGDDETPATSF